MSEVELPEWPGIEDLRPVKQEAVFQSPPFKVAVNSNRGLYTDFGMKEILVEQAKEVYKQVMNEK